MIIRRLLPSDAAAFKTLRLAALQDSPSAFSASYEEERDTPIATIEQRLAPGSVRTVFGAFEGSELLGLVGAGRESQPKLRHKGYISGMVVTGTRRGTGIATPLLLHAIDFIASLEGVRHIVLSVTAGNAAAIGMYERQGFTVCGREPEAMCVDGVFYDVLTMTRPLGSA